jgi:hypothetical protein
MANGKWRMENACGFAIAIFRFTSGRLFCSGLQKTWRYIYGMPSA